MDKVLLFGVNGFLGSHFVEYINKNKLFKNYNFIACYRSNFTKYDFIHDYIKCDITNQKDVIKVILKCNPSYILNFAGTYHTNDFSELYKQNVIGTKNILDAIINAKCPLKKIVLLGSAAEYGISEKLPIKEYYKKKPVTKYGLSKLFQSELLHFFYENYKLPYCQAIIYNVIGDRMPVDLSIGNFAMQINNSRNGDIISVGNLNTYRDFITVKNLCESLWLLLIYGKKGEAYNVCSGKPTKIQTVLNKLIRDSRKKLKIQVEQKNIKSNDVKIIFGSNAKLEKLINNL
jgi:GDP-4-dehydro-6-deoxy-D-mannose reductase